MDGNNNTGARHNYREACCKGDKYYKYRTEVLRLLFILMSLLLSIFLLLLSILTLLLFEPILFVLLQEFDPLLFLSPTELEGLHTESGLLTEVGLFDALPSGLERLCCAFTIIPEIKIKPVENSSILIAFFIYLLFKMN
jgi:hypothetical protein